MDIEISKYAKADRKVGSSVWSAESDEGLMKEVKMVLLISIYNAID